MTPLVVFIPLFFFRYKENIDGRYARVSQIKMKLKKKSQDVTEEDIQSLKNRCQLIRDITYNSFVETTFPKTKGLKLLSLLKTRIKSTKYLKLLCPLCKKLLMGRISLLPLEKGDLVLQKETRPFMAYLPILLIMRPSLYKSFSEYFYKLTVLNNRFKSFRSKKELVTNWRKKSEILKSFQNITNIAIITIIFAEMYLLYFPVF